MTLNGNDMKIILDRLSHNTVGYYIDQRDYLPSLEDHEIFEEIIAKSFSHLKMIRKRWSEINLDPKDYYFSETKRSVVLYEYENITDEDRIMIKLKLSDMAVR